MSPTRGGPTPLVEASNPSLPSAVIRWRRRPIWLLAGVLALCVWGIYDDLGNADEERTAFADAPIVVARITDMSQRDDRVQVEYTDPSTNETVDTSVYVFDDDRFPADGASTVEIEIGSTDERPVRVRGDRFLWTQNLLMYPTYASLPALWVIARRRWIHSTRRIAERIRTPKTVIAAARQAHGASTVTTLQCRVAQLGVRGRWHLVAVSDAAAKSALVVIPIIGAPDFPIDPIVDVGVVGKIGWRRRITPVQLPAGQSTWWPAGRSRRPMDFRETKAMIDLLANADDAEGVIGDSTADDGKPLAETISPWPFSRAIKIAGVSMIALPSAVTMLSRPAGEDFIWIGLGIALAGLVVLIAHGRRDDFVALSEGRLDIGSSSRSVGAFNVEVFRLAFGRRSTLPRRGRIRFEPDGLAVALRGAERLLPWDQFESIYADSWSIDFTTNPRNPTLIVLWKTEGATEKLFRRRSIVCGNAISLSFDPIPSPAAALLIRSIAARPDQQRRLDCERDIRLLLCSVYARRSLAGDDPTWDTLDEAARAPKFWTG